LHIPVFLITFGAVKQAEMGGNPTEQSESGLPEALVKGMSVSEKSVRDGTENRRR